jgi:hypothetical protein
MTYPVTGAYIPEHLERWTSADPAFGSTDNYAGPDLSEFYIAPISNGRDTADSVTLSNWRVIGSELERLASHPESGVARFGHWAVGWYELWLIHSSDSEALECADSWAAALSDYPVASEDDLSELESEEECQAWDSWGAREWRDTLAQRLEQLYSDSLPDSAPWDWGADQAEGLSDEQLYELWHLGGNRCGWSVEHGSDGPRFNFEGAAESLTTEDLAPYVTVPEPASPPEHTCAEPPRDPLTVKGYD